MLSLKGNQDRFKLTIPDGLIPDEILEKYTNILKRKHSFITNPNDFINETIQKVQVLGFSSATIQQAQPGPGNPVRNARRVEENKFLHSHSDFTYRSQANPLQLIDKTLNIDFRHVAGYLNYFILFESFFYQFCRDTSSTVQPKYLNIDIYNEAGEIYSRIILYDPIIDAMDMLDLDFTQPIASSQTFRVVFKYSNIDFQFVEDDYVSYEEENNPVYNDL